MYVAIALGPNAYFHFLNTWIPLFYYFLYDYSLVDIHNGQCDLKNACQYHASNVEIA